MVSKGCHRELDCILNCGLPVWVRKIYRQTDKQPIRLIKERGYVEYTKIELMLEKRPTILRGSKQKYPLPGFFFIEPPTARERKKGGGGRRGGGERWKRGEREKPSTKLKHRKTVKKKERFLTYTKRRQGIQQKREGRERERTPFHKPCG